MSATIEQAALVTAPTQVYTNTVTTTADSSATEIGNGREVSRYITMVCTDAFYVTFGGSDVTEPDNTVTNSTPASPNAAATWYVPAKTPTSFFVSSNVTHFKLQGTASSTVLWYFSSP